MTTRRSYVGGGVLLSFALLVGCGKGLPVTVSSTPNPAVPGSPYSLTMQLHNDTQCATADDVALPLGPSGIPPIAVVFAFTSNLQPGPLAICRALETCQDIDCFNNIAGGALSGALLDRLREAATELAASRGSAAALNGVVPDTCMEIQNDEFGVVGICAYDPLAPGASASLTLTGITPDTGVRSGAQLALSLAGARGADCSPGFEVADGEWQLGGCFAVAPSEQAPVLSRGGFAMLLAALLAVTSLGLRRRRQG